MTVLLQLGLFFFTLQAKLTQSAQLNHDDNMSIEGPKAVGNSIIPSAFTNIPSGGNVAGGLQWDREQSYWSTRFGAKNENSVTQPTEENEQHYDHQISTLTNTINANDATVNVEGLAKDDAVTMTLQDSVTSIHAATQKIRTDSDPDADNVVTATNDPADSSEVTGSASQSNDTEKMEELTKTFVIPDAIGHYSNNIMLEGHVFGIRDDVLSMIHTALSSGDIFIPVQSLAVQPLSSSFEEMGYEGDKVTSIQYVVSYNGRPIHTEIVTRLMGTPKVSHHFSKQLEGRHLRQYKKAQPVKNKSWIHQHLSAVIIPACVAFVLIILIVVFIVARRRYAGASEMKKKRPSKFETKGKNKCPPPPYGIENPVYDFEANAVMDGYTFP